MRRGALFGWIFCFAAVLEFLGVTVAGAQSAPDAVSSATATVSVAANLPDYSQGFRAFIGMGLPDVSKASYVKLDYYGAGLQYSANYNLYEIQLSGNAWLVSEDKAANSVLISGVGGRLELLDQKTALKMHEARARSNAVAQAAAAKEGGGKPDVTRVTYQANEFADTGNWTPTDLSRDLAKAKSYVDKKIKAKAVGGREMSYDSFLHSDEPAGALFIMAAFAWQNGKVQEANGLAGSLFKLIGDPRKVIVGALNVMADAQLSSAGDVFRKTRDWNAYQAAVAGLVKKYPAGWRKAGAARLLAERLQLRAGMLEPPAVKGDGLVAEDMKLAAALASETNQVSMYGGLGDLWVLPQDKAARARMDNSALGRIKARGVRSIPLLIALVSDETLCPLRRNDVGLPTSSSSSDSDDRKPEAERARLLYERIMDRPVTRGEIARGLLAPICKSEENARHDESETAPEEVIETAKKTYATLKDLPPSALVRYYLNNGDQNQKQAAVSYMLQHDVETNAPAIEAFLLTPPSEESGGIETMMWSGNSLAQQYVEKRGEKAADFVEKYAAMRKKIELPPAMADNAGYAKQMEKQAESELATLRGLVKKRDISELVAELTKAGEEEKGTTAAYTLLGRQPPGKAIPALLAAVVKTTNVVVRSRILQTIPMLRYASLERAHEESPEADEEATEAVMKKLADKNKLNIGVNAAEWRVLLSDTRAIPAGRMYSGGVYAWTIADVAATDIETLYGDSSLTQRYDGRYGGMENLPPESMAKSMRARAAARLDGKTEEQLPKMPSADDVTAERRKAIEADILKAAPEALGGVIDMLTDAEGLYLAEAVGENAALAKVLAPLSRSIASVKAAPELPAAELARLQKLTGTTISTNAIAELREICGRQLATGAVFAVSLASDGIGKGFSLNVVPADKAFRRMYESSYGSRLSGKRGQRIGLVMGMLRNGRVNASSTWVVDLPAPVASTGTVEAAADESDDNADEQLDALKRSFERQAERFQTALESLCKPDEPVGQGASVSFTGLLPAKEKDKKKGEDDEDDGGGEVIDVVE